MRPFENLGEFLLAVRSSAYRQDDPRLVRSAAGLSVGVGSQGGFVVPEPFLADIRLRVYGESLAGMCTSVPMAAGGLKIPVIDETSRADGSRLGGVQGYWIDEAAAITPSKPKFGLQTQSANKLGIAAWATSELADDAPAFGSTMSKILSAEAAVMLDAAIVNGQGAGRPVGILNSTALITTSKEGGQASATITGRNLTTMYRRLWGPSRRKAVWLVNEDTDGYLLEAFLAQKNVAGTENVGGSPAYIPPAADGEYGRLLGRPVIPCEQMPALGQLGDIVLADLTEFVIGDRGMTIKSSIHQDFSGDQVLYRLIHRVDGRPGWKQPVTPKSGSSTLSPFVTLEAR